MGEERSRPARYRLTSGILWGTSQGLISWFLVGAGLGKSIGAAFGGLAAGWVTAAVLGRLARWGTGTAALAILGLVVGVAAASGAATGLGSLANWYDTRRLGFDWEHLGRYVLSAAAVPAAILGLLTGLYVRARVPRPPRS